jgi:transposase
MSKQATPQRKDDNPGNEKALYVAIELSLKTWKLAISDGSRNRPRVISIDAKDWKAFEDELKRARKRLELPESTAIRSCYEAGREGFWVHRALIRMGIENVIVDAASMEVNRRRKQVKTDRVDAEKLVHDLMRYWSGDRRVWSVVRVPTEEVEDGRQLHRDLGTLQSEAHAHRLRIQSLLFTQGVDVKVGRKFLQQLEQLRRWDGQPIKESLRQRLEREYQRLQLAEAMMAELRQKQKQMLKADKTPAIEKARRLQQLGGIGMRSSWVFSMECFGWRKFRNRREVGAAFGMVGVPHQSGQTDHEQGISRAGNKTMRAMAIEIAWAWLRLQPQSELSRWFKRWFAGGGARMRKIGIVGLGRRLMIALWRYLETGIPPQGARLKAAAPIAP